MLHVHLRTFRISDLESMCMWVNIYKKRRPNNTHTLLQMTGFSFGGNSRLTATNGGGEWRARGVTGNWFLSLVAFFFFVGQYIQCINNVVFGKKSNQVQGLKLNKLLSLSLSFSHSFCGKLFPLCCIFSIESKAQMFHLVDRMHSLCQCRVFVLTLSSDTDLRTKKT